jgi:hypothetical protein
MGALRAAELAVFGMEGVGVVFESYRDGILKDDDEVAIAHGPAETGFVALSEAMVNIRHTLRKAEGVGVISGQLRAELVTISKELFYPHRTYSALLRRASDGTKTEVELARLREWLSHGRVNQKRDDAIAMLRLIRERLMEGLSRKEVSYSFEQTSSWECLCRNNGVGAA